jgi:hypothetical protein
MGEFRIDGKFLGLLGKYEGEEQCWVDGERDWMVKRERKEVIRID